MLVGEAAWSGERVGELRQLAKQIQLHITDEPSNDTPIVSEVEKLGFRITNLTEAIQQLGNHLAKQPVDNSKEQNKHKVQEAVEKTEELLALPPPQPDEALQRADKLKNQLLALGCKNGPSVDLRPDDESIESWENVIGKTHGRYEQVLKGLIGDDDQLEAALITWGQYVDTVEDNMSVPAPASRQGLHEAARLCQVHKSILTTQNNVLNTLKEQSEKTDAQPRLKNLQGRLKELILRHQGALTSVTQREELLMSTISTWEVYRLKVAQIQTWLLSLEQDKQNLQLRQVARRRLDKVVERLKSLLDQVYRGEDQVGEVSALCQQLISTCDSSIHPILKAELASLQQRTTNLHSGIETWLEYLNHSCDLWNRYENIYEKIQNKLNEFQQGLFEEMPTEFLIIKTKIQEYNEIIVSLQAMNDELTTLRATREEMVDSLTPADLRLVTQRMWRVSQLQAELIHQYRLRISNLEDHLELWQLYDTRYHQFMTWANEMSTKIDGGSEQYIDSIIRKLEYDYQDEISMKSVDKLWLISESEELISSSDPEQVAELKKKIENIEAIWKNVNDKCNNRKQKLKDIVTTIRKAELTLSELKEWLFMIEKKLSSPVVFQNSSSKEIDRLLEIEEEIRKEIEKQSSNISSVLNLCDMVISDCSKFDASGDTDSLQEAYRNLDKRWGDICTRSADRKIFIKKTRKMWEELFNVHESFDSWLKTMESQVGNGNARSTYISYGELHKAITSAHELQQQIHDETPQYEELNQKYRVLARPYGRENRLDQENKIKNIVKSANLRFHTLSYYITVIIRRLRFSYKMYEDFEIRKDEVMAWLNDFDNKITDFENKQDLDDTSRKKTLCHLIISFEEQEDDFAEFEKLIEGMYQRSKYSDCLIIEESLLDFYTTRELLRTRLISLRRLLPIETLEATKVTKRESTPEHSSIVSDDDLSLSLVPDSELSSVEPTLGAVDISLIGAVGGRSLTSELKAAIEESKRLLSQLEEALKSPTPQGSEVDKTYYTFVSIFSILLLPSNLNML